jgi:hypothetical protein
MPPSRSTQRADRQPTGGRRPPTQPTARPAHVPRRHRLLVEHGRLPHALPGGGAGGRPRPLRRACQGSPHRRRHRCARTPRGAWSGSHSAAGPVVLRGRPHLSARDARGSAAALSRDRGCSSGQSRGARSRLGPASLRLIARQYAPVCPYPCVSEAPVWVSAARRRSSALLRDGAGMAPREPSAQHGLFLARSPHSMSQRVTKLSFVRPKDQRGGSAQRSSLQSQPTGARPTYSLRGAPLPLLAPLAT